MSKKLEKKAEGINGYFYPVSARLTSDDFKRLKAYCKEHDLAAADVFREGMRMFLDQPTQLEQIRKLVLQLNDTQGAFSRELKASYKAINTIGNGLLALIKDVKELKEAQKHG